MKTTEILIVSKNAKLYKTIDQHKYQSKVKVTIQVPVPDMAQSQLLKYYDPGSFNADIMDENVFSHYLLL